MPGGFPNLGGLMGGMGGAGGFSEFLQNPAFMDMAKQVRGIVYIM